MHNIAVFDFYFLAGKTPFNELGLISFPQSRINMYFVGD